MFPLGINGLIQMLYKGDNNGFCQYIYIYIYIYIELSSSFLHEELNLMHNDMYSNEMLNNIFMSIECYKLKRYL